jgi:hypothetical protein
MEYAAPRNRDILHRPSSALTHHPVLHRPSSWWPWLPPAIASCPDQRCLIAAYNPAKNLSSIARRADSRVTQAACIAIAIEPWILSS